jgi:hypothetical protein
MALIDYFEDEKDVSTVINRSVTTKAEDGSIEKESAVIDTILSIFFLSSQAQSLIADKHRESTDAVCIIGLDDTPIKKGDILDINNNKYSVMVRPDDVALRGEAIVCLLKEIN